MSPRVLKAFWQQLSTDASLRTRARRFLHPSPQRPLHRQVQGQVTPVRDHHQPPRRQDSSDWGCATDGMQPDGSGTSVQAATKPRSARTPVQTAPGSAGPHQSHGVAPSRSTPRNRAAQLVSSSVSPSVWQAQPPPPMWGRQLGQEPPWQPPGSRHPRASLPRLPDQLPRHAAPQEELERVAVAGQHWQPDGRGQLYNQHQPDDTRVRFNNTGQFAVAGAAPLTRANAFGQPDEIRRYPPESSPSSDSSLLAMPPLQRSFSGGALQPECQDGRFSQQWTPHEGQLYFSTAAAWDLEREPDVSGWLPDNSNVATHNPHPHRNGSVHQQQPQSLQQWHMADNAESQLHR